MPAPRKFDLETRERAVRMYLDRLAEHGGSKREARRRVGALLDINEASIRNWVEAGERTAGVRPGVSRQTDSEEVRSLKRRVAELERANEILKTAGLHSTGQRNTFDDDLGGGAAWRRSEGRGCRRTSGSRCGTSGRLGMSTAGES